MTTAISPKPLDEERRRPSDTQEMSAAPPKRRLWPWLLGAGLLIAAVVGWRLWSQHGAAEAAARGREVKPVPVVTVAAHAGDLPVLLRGLGTVTALKTATIRSRVDGQLMNVAFTEGQHVKEGELLAQLDPRPFQVQLEQAQGQLARDQAAQKDAQVNLDRLQSLYADQIVPQQQLDTQRSQVNQLQGALASDQAQVHSAELQLSYSRITAPFGGRTGLRLVDPGNIVHAADPGGLLVLTQVHPIAVIFSLPQDQLPEVLAKLKAGTSLEVDAFDRDNSKQIAAGKLLTTDNQIDTTTGTYKLKASFDNEDDALFPNQFVNVRLRLDMRKGLVLVPSAAIQRGSQGTFVYVVGQDQLAHVQAVTVALSEGDDTGTSDGLKVGDTVVVDGQDKLQEGSKVDLGGGKDQAADGKPAPAGSPSGGKAKGGRKK